MPLFKHVVLPVDFSDRSVGAAHFVEALAKPGETKVTLLNVVTPLTYELSAMEIGASVLTEAMTERHKEAKQQLESFLREELEPWHPQRVVLEGDPAHELVRYAHDHQADLICLPTHGYGMFRRFLLGSVTAKVLHDAECPVWTGTHMQESQGKIEFRTIIAAIDLQYDPAMRALKFAQGLAAEHKARLLVAHAFPSLEGVVGENFDPNWRTYFRDVALEEIEKLKKEAGVAAGDTIVEPGDPARIVSSIAEREKADLVVIGRGSAGGVFGRLRANAYAIIRQTPCPVVSV